MKPSVGRIVHYVLDSADGVRPDAVGQIRPAIIVRDWNNGQEVSEGGSAVQLQVFLDGSNDHPDGLGLVWATSVCYAAEGTKPRTWHWPKREDTPAVHLTGAGASLR